jgi:hypothetical protein
MKIDRFDRTNLGLLRSDLEAALAGVAKKYGVSLNLGAGRFSSDNVTFKLEGAVIRAEGVVTKEAAAFKSYAEIWGLEPGDLGKTFVQGRKTFQIVGAKPSSHKYPILAKELGTNKSYKFTVADIRRRLFKPLSESKAPTVERFWVTEDSGQFFVLDTHANRRLRGGGPNGEFADEAEAERHCALLNGQGGTPFGFNNRHED